MAETGDSEMDDGTAAVLRTDGAVALGGRAGDRSAPAGETAIAERFDDIVRSHEGRVLGLARRLLGRREDAEDAAQESFLRLYRALDRLDPERPVLPYLYQLTLNVCRDLRRRGHRRGLSAVPLEEIPPTREPACEGAGPDRVARIAEERRIAEAALRALPEKQRLALVLRDLHGLTTSEVAEALGVAEVTVRTQISRARLKVKEFRDRALGSAPGTEETTS
jgi:RNA polymerase sigma-70 factor (ECF subfamily)